ncbi:MAG TPA: hypothetical protein VFH61_17860 [Thermoleophilia bacterium]|nr:hypothetical protein [Thermoleophilia bacterium]
MTTIKAGSRVLELPSFKIGDRVEIMVFDTWRRGTVVGINLLCGPRDRLRIWVDECDERLSINGATHPASAVRLLSVIDQLGQVAAGEDDPCESA